MSEVINKWRFQLWKIHYDTRKKLSFFAMNLSDSKRDLHIEQNVPKHKKPPVKRSKGQYIGLCIGPLLFLFTQLFVSPEGMTSEAQAVLACTLWIATWWVTDAIPIPVTSLLPIILFPLSGAIEKGVADSYADETIFLFLGGFIIAIALEKWNLHRRIALHILLLVGASTQRIIMGFMLVTAFLSMWLSNTATAMMMLPIALSIVTHVTNSLAKTHQQEENFNKSLMLAVAYSASIGGVATLIGTPPNTILAGVINELYGVSISFAKWLMFGAPISAVLLVFVWFYLVKLKFPMKVKEIPGGKEVIQKQKNNLGKIRYEEKAVAVIFIFTALFWMTRPFILIRIFPMINDSIIAILAAVLLFLVPSKNSEDNRLLNWGDAKKVDWGVLLLFGGGLAIAKGFKDSGLAQWISLRLIVLQDVPNYLIVICVALLVLLLSELTSNTATSTMMYPIMASLALSLDFHPFVLMVTASIAAALTFMLPVSTPPNAIVFSSGYFKIKEMAIAGFWVNIFCIIFIPIMTYFLLPFVWGIDIIGFPDGLK